GALAHSLPTAPARPKPPPRTRARPAAPAPATARPSAPSGLLPDGRERNPIAFGGPVGPLGLFGVGLGDQGAWMLPFAVFGLLATALVTLGAGRDRRDRRAPAPRRPRGRCLGGGRGRVP